MLEGPAQLSDLLTKGVLAGFIVEAAGLRASCLCGTATPRLWGALSYLLQAAFPARPCVIGGERPDATSPFAARSRALASCLCLDLECGRWEALPRMPTARSRCAAAAEGALLYSVGGRGRGGVGGREWLPLPMLERFDADAWAWEALLPMPTPRYGLGAALSRGHLYAVGGSDGRQPLAAAERFSLLAGTWEVLPPLPTPREGLALAAVADRVLAAGGSALGGPWLGAAAARPPLESYDPTANAWEAVTCCLPLAPGPCIAVATDDGQLCVLGGRRSDSEDIRRSGTAWCWQRPPVGPWRALPSPAAGHGGGLAATAAGGWLLVAGGYRELRPCGQVEVLALSNPERGWQYRPPLPECAHAAGVSLRVPRRWRSPAREPAGAPPAPSLRRRPLSQLGAQAWLSSLLGQSVS